MPILVSCPRCSSRLQFDDALAGRPVRCGGCQMVFALPAAPAAAPSAGTLAFACGSCKGQLKLGVQFAGQRVRCPLCQQVILAPAQAGSAPPSAPAPAAPPPKEAAPAPAAVTPPKAAPPPPLPEPRREKVNPAPAEPPQEKATPPAPQPRREKSKPVPPPPEPADDLVEATVMEDELVAATVMEEPVAETAEPEETPRSRPKPRKPARFGKRLLLIAGAAVAFVLVLTCAGVWWSFHLESFDDAPREFRPGTAVRLRQLESSKAPGPAEQMLYAHKHQRLFLRSKERVRVVDTSTMQAEEPLAPQRDFVDMGLSPFEDSLFVADQGAHEAGRATDKQAVHRYDLHRKRWDVRTTATDRETVYTTKRVNDQWVKKTATGTRDVQAVANPMKVVSGSRLLILPGVGWGRLSLNSWGSGQALHEQAKAAPFDHLGHFAYDPRTGRTYYTSFRPDVPPLGVKRVAGAWLLDAQPSSSKSDQDAVRKLLIEKGGALTLSTNGKRLYVGRLQFDVRDLSKPLREFPEPIRAASDDLAFGEKQAYYNAETGEKVGDFEPYAYQLALSTDGSRLWVYDANAEKLILYAIEGDK